MSPHPRGIEQQPFNVVLTPKNVTQVPLFSKPEERLCNSSNCNYLVFY